MRLFDPDIRPNTIRPKQQRARNAWFRPGECLRLIYDELRDAVQPMTTRQLAERIMRVKVSTITLFDGPVIADIDVLPASASRLLYGGREAEAGSGGCAAPLSRFIGFEVVPGSRVAERPPFACAPASGGCR
jgi:hypothetical protein